MDFRPVRGLVRGVWGSAAFCKVWDWGGLIGLEEERGGAVWGGNSAASGTRLESLGPGWRDLGGSGRGLGGSGEGSRAWQGFWRGLGGFGRSLGRSASLACPTTLAKSVEMWEVRAAVWVWLCLERFGGFGAGLVALGPCRGCGTVGVRADVWVWLFWNDPGADKRSGSV